MKKNTKIIIAVATAIVVVAGIVAAVLIIINNKKDPLIGSWAHDSYIYTFNEDKTCSYGYGSLKMDCTYEAKDNKLSILYNGSTAPFETTYSINGNELNVVDSFGNDTIYIKK